MIKVTRLSGEEILVNCDQIEFIEIESGTVISFVSGKKVRIAESAIEVVKLVTAYKKNIYFGIPATIDRTNDGK